MKNFILAALILAAVLCFTGCGRNAGAGIWEEVLGEYVREDSNQYNNGVLQMMYLSNSCVMFEFRLMEGSESENYSYDFVIPGILIVDDNGKGQYNTLPDSDNPVSIDFEISKDGQTVTVTHIGEIEISPDGVYKFVNAGLEVSEISATSILEHLPTAMTSLNSNLGEYTVMYPDGLIDDWFYPVEAIFNDTGVTLAKFLIAKDLSAVFRVDDDIEPVLIFGSAQPMMDAYVYVWHDDEHAGYFGEDEVIGEAVSEPKYIVTVIIEDGIVLMSGQSSRLNAFVPGGLPFILTMEAVDEDIVKIDENGVVWGISEGETTISGTLEVEDGIGYYSIEIYVTNDVIEYEELILDD